MRSTVMLWLATNEGLVLMSVFASSKMKEETMQSCAFHPGRIQQIWQLEEFSFPDPAQHYRHKIVRRYHCQRAIKSPSKKSYLYIETSMKLERELVKFFFFLLKRAERQLWGLLPHAPLSFWCAHFKIVWLAWQWIDLDHLWLKIYHLLSMPEHYWGLAGILFQ